MRTLTLVLLVALFAAAIFFGGIGGVGILLILIVIGGAITALVRNSRRAA
jgi:hypothetical protein